MKEGGMRIAVLLLGTLLLLSADAVEPSVSWGAGRKKVVSSGWEWRYMTPSDYVKCADRIDETGLDGVVVYITVAGHDGDQEWMSHRISDGKIAWTKDMVADQVSDFRKVTAHPGMRESFIRSLGSPRTRLDWADDALWGKIAKNMGVLAWLAKQGGFRGLAVDPEDYSQAKQFKRRPGDEPWDVLAPLARRRGREIFSEVFKEYPEAVVFFYWLLSWEIDNVTSNDSLAAARTTGDLWPAFVNGILDVMPPTAQLVDGAEWAYKIEASRHEFSAWGVAERNAEFGLVDPENRAKYRGQVLPSFGHYLDSYTNPETNAAGKASEYYFGPENGSRLGHFERNLASSLRNCGGYVWLWGETYSWITHDPSQRMIRAVRHELWSDKLPGINAVLRVCANPKAFLAKDLPVLRQAGLMRNLKSDVDVARLSAEAKAGGRKRFSVRIPANEVRPGTHYVLAVDGHGDGLNVGIWWGNRLPTVRIALKKIDDARHRGVMVVSVPEDANGMIIDFNMRPDPGQTCAFDNFYLGIVPSEMKQNERKGN